MPAAAENRIQLGAEHELDRIVSLKQASELCNLSPWTIKRHHPGKLIQLSPKRLGMRLRDALMLSESA